MGNFQALRVWLVGYQLILREIFLLFKPYMDLHPFGGQDAVERVEFMVHRTLLGDWPSYRSPQIEPGDPVELTQGVHVFDPGARYEERKVDNVQARRNNRLVPKAYRCFWVHSKSPVQ